MLIVDPGSLYVDGDQNHTVWVGTRVYSLRPKRRNGKSLLLFVTRGSYRNAVKTSQNPNGRNPRVLRDMKIVTRNPKMNIMYR